MKTKNRREFAVTDPDDANIWADELMTYEEALQLAKDNVDASDGDPEVETVAFVFKVTKVATVKSKTEVTIDKHN